MGWDLCLEDLTGENCKEWIRNDCPEEKMNWDTSRLVFRKEVFVKDIFNMEKEYIECPLHKREEYYLCHFGDCHPYRIKNTDEIVEKMENYKEASLVEKADIMYIFRILEENKNYYLSDSY